MITTTDHHYQLSPRVTLTPGDQFTVSGGPYYRSSDGRTVRSVIGRAAAGVAPSVET